MDYYRFWGYFGVFTLVYYTSPSVWKSTYFVQWTLDQRSPSKPNKIYFLRVQYVCYRSLTQIFVCSTLKKVMALQKVDFPPFPVQIFSKVPIKKMLHLLFRLRLYILRALDVCFEVQHFLELRSH